MTTTDHTPPSHAGSLNDSVDFWMDVQDHLVKIGQLSKENMASREEVEKAITLRKSQRKLDNNTTSKKESIRD